MIKKIFFGLMWFVIIFMVSYLATGVIVVLLTVGIGSNWAIYEAAQAFRNTYILFFAIGSLILVVVGGVTGILPGTKGKKNEEKKPSAKKKALKKRKR